MSTEIRIATRNSPLALWQAQAVQAAIAKCSQVSTVLVPMTSEGDQILDRPLSEVGGKGLFISRLEQALLEEEADIAVHSMKDVPTILDAPFTIAAMMPRHDPADVLISPYAFEDLPKASVLGTCSYRRAGQVKKQRPDIRIAPLRGNLQTRLRKLGEGEYDAIILARAGVERLGLEASVPLQSLPWMLPAPAQGAVGVECLSGREDLQSLLAKINHQETFREIEAERKMAAALNGDCHSPIACLSGFAVEAFPNKGAYAWKQEGEASMFRMVAQVVHPEGTACVEHSVVTDAKDYLVAAEHCAQVLLDRGAQRILDWNT